MYKKAIRITLTIFLVLLLGFGIWLANVLRHYTAPILMYHYINDEEPKRSKLGVSLATFERQMRFLRENKYNVIPLGELADIIKKKKKIPPKTAVVTFDDGYLDNYTNAFPILKKYGIPATIFIVIDRVGRRLGRDDYMDWQQIKELSDSGLVTIGCHSMTHPNLSEILSEEELKREICQSKLLLEGVLGKGVDLFSYPFGGINPKARSFVMACGYRAAVGTNFPLGYPNDDIIALKRLRISESAGNMFVFWVEISGFYTYVKEHRDSY